MMSSPWSAAAWGAAFGLANGGLSRLAVQRALNKADKVFYGAYAAGFLWRLCFIGAAVWFLRDKKYIILLPFFGALIFTQFVLEVLPAAWLPMPGGPSRGKSGKSAPERKRNGSAGMTG